MIRYTRDANPGYGYEVRGLGALGLWPSRQHQECLERVELVELTSVAYLLISHVSPGRSYSRFSRVPLKTSCRPGHYHEFGLTPCPLEDLTPSRTTAAVSAKRAESR